MADEDVFDNCCPLCIQPFNEQDKQFRPCKLCTFRLCLWCWHTIVTLATSDHTCGTCPQCRTPYDVESIQRMRVSGAVKSRPPRKSHPSRAALADVVVNDRKVVAVRNIPAVMLEAGGSTLDDRIDAVHQHFLFGQYGRIVGVVLLRHADAEAFNALIRFSTTDEATRCAQSVDGAALCGKTLSCVSVPTRYCNAFLLKTTCQKKMCVELHHEVHDKTLVAKSMNASTLPVMGLVAGLASDMNPATSNDRCCAPDGATDVSVRDRVFQLAESWADRTLQSVRDISVSGLREVSMAMSDRASSSTASMPDAPTADSFSTPVAEAVAQGRRARIAGVQFVAAVNAVQSAAKIRHRQKADTPATLSSLCLAMPRGVAPQIVELALPVPHNRRR